jgi:hypothetical protein
MNAMKLAAAIFVIGATTALTACSHPMVRKDVTTTTVTQPPPIVEQHTTSKIVPAD